MAEKRPAVRRGEGEVRDWPRGLVAYVPATPDSVDRDPEEDRGTNRQRLALRLLDLQARAGGSVDRARARLGRAARLRTEGRSAEADAEVEAVLGELLDPTGALRPPPRLLPPGQRSH
ncbi:MAG: hypothetical protein ACYCPN_02480 [Thermoplasmata archaeon]